MPLSFYGHTHEQPDNVPPIYLGLRTDNYLFVEYDDGFLEYYDLTNDAAQMENIADQIDEDTNQGYKDWLDKFIVSAGDECRNLENEFSA